MRKQSIFTSILLVVLIAAMALSFTACSSKKSGGADGQAPGLPTAIGEGSVSFTLEVTPYEGETKSYTVSTDAETVGDALLELELIDGDESEFGLYVKTVDGVTYDYDTDGRYWAFYIDGEYASTGVDATPVSAGTVYALKGE